jgi:hypothetical protein
VDAMLKPTADSPLPHLLVHVAREVITPLGSCAAGMLLLNPDMKEVPDLFSGRRSTERMATILNYQK